MKKERGGGEGNLHYLQLSNENLDFIKNKNVCSVKNTVTRMKRKATDWEKTFEKHISYLIKDLYAKYTKKKTLKTQQLENKQIYFKNGPNFKHKSHS